jgi:hypothetical protein
LFDFGKLTGHFGRRRRGCRGSRDETCDVCRLVASRVASNGP